MNNVVTAGINSLILKKIVLIPYCLQNNAHVKELKEVEEEITQKNSKILVQMYLNGSYPTTHEEWLQV